MTAKKLLVTGGAGFIGSAVVRQIMTETDWQVLNIDCLTYAGNLASIAMVADDPRYQFARLDITDFVAIEKAVMEFQPDYVLHLAAESHVDRSIDSASPFIQTNIVGTHSMLEACTQYWRQLDAEQQQAFRFHHVSTDEVFGSLGETGLFTETTPYSPRSPYSASKAGSDHLVSAWYHTHGLPIVMTNCSNNYGPFQFPEKLIPLMILNARAGKPLPVYGKGENVRDWLHVDDHVRAMRCVLTTGAVGETYNVGGNAERQNIDVVTTICAVIDELLSDSTHRPHKTLIEYVQDRPGHDLRYAIDASKIKNDLGWEPQETFESGIRNTVEWYLNNQGWWQPILDGSYQGERLGLNSAG